MLSKQKVKYIQSLGQKKFRRETGLFIAEGPKLVEEIIRDHSTGIVAVYALKEWIQAHPSPGIAAMVTEIEPGDLAKISQLSSPQLVLAIVKQFPVPEIPSAAGRFTLVLDTIQEPGNFGTLLRIADWFGIEQVVCSGDSADCYNHKVVQASMGSIARVQVFYTNLPGWLEKQEGVPVFAAVLDGTPLGNQPPVTEGILVIGNESAGISAEVLAKATVKLTIPGKGKAESLNAAVAAGILCAQLLT